MSRRTLAYIGIAVSVLVLGRLLATRSPASPAPAPPASTAPGSSAPVTAPRAGPPLRRPPASVVSLGVLTHRPEDEVRAAIDRGALAALVGPALCGDAAACDAVRASIRDEHATTLGVTPVSDWNLGHIDVDASAGALSPAERASVALVPRVVVIHVAMATSPRQLALRTAFAAAAALADRLGGFVHDPLLSRIERARDFAAHAITSPLGGTAFRPDRIELLYEPQPGGVVRVLTAGLSRWGAPDVEAPRVPALAESSVAAIVLGVAEALANGAEAGPVTLSRDDLARTRGVDDPTDAGLPPPGPVAIDVVSVQPEPGDPNDFIARVEPPNGHGPLGYVELAEQFFSPLLGLSPEPEVAQRRRDQAQSQLSAALARAAGGAKLLVLLPFPIPGDAGLEFMWVEVHRSDARTITGRLVDDPLGATDLSRGDEVSRPRAQVEDLRWPGAPSR